MSKKSSQSSVPGFDPGEFMNLFDPSKMMAEMNRMMQGIGGADMTHLLDGQRKNLQALTEANQRILQGAQAVIQRQTEIMQQAAAEAAALGQSMAGSNPAEIAGKQTEIMRQAYARATAHVQAVSDDIVSAQRQALDTLNKRWQESLQELQQAGGKKA